MEFPLTIPPLSDCGRCLVDERVRVSFACANAGGPGRFQLLPADHPSLPRFLPAPPPVASSSGGKADTLRRASQTGVGGGMAGATTTAPFVQTDMGQGQPQPPQQQQFASFVPTAGDGSGGGRVAPSWNPSMDADDDDDDDEGSMSGTDLYGAGGSRASGERYSERDLLPLDDWLAADEGHLAPFSIAPTQFALMHGEEMEFQIEFQPHEARAFSRGFVLLCDNNQV